MRAILIATDQKKNLEIHISMQTVKNIFDLKKFNSIFGKTIFNYYKKFDKKKQVELLDEKNNIVPYDPCDYR